MDVDSALTVDSKKTFAAWREFCIDLLKLGCEVGGFLTCHSSLNPRVTTREDK